MIAMAAISDLFTRLEGRYATGPHFRRDTSGDSWRFSEQSQSESSVHFMHSLLVRNHALHFALIAFAHERRDPKFRFRFLLFDVRMWRRCERPRFTFPVPVNLKRLAAPLCVFSFGINLIKLSAITSASVSIRSRRMSLTLRRNSNPL